MDTDQYYHEMILPPDPRNPADEPDSPEPEEDEEEEEEDNWQPCDECDLPDACADFGCAIQKGLREPSQW